MSKILSSLAKNIEGDINTFGQEYLTDEALVFLETAEQALEHAFQPIVNIHNGTIFGYEALLRNHRALNCESVFQVFDVAERLNILHRFDMIMRAKAIAKFASLARFDEAKLFYNADNRTIGSADYFRGGTKYLLKKNGVQPSSFCLEISERHELSMQSVESSLKYYHDEAYNTAIDDFGTGYSGLKLLKEYHPNFIKIDRSFITGIDQNNKTRLLASTIVDLAHILGIFVIAEGVETQEELWTCQEIGCDLLQGYFIARPEINNANLKAQYQIIMSSARTLETKSSVQNHMIHEKIEYREPLKINDDMETVLEAFRLNKEQTFFPVVDETGVPVGIVRELAIKEYVYSPYGKALLANPGNKLKLRKFISPCPVADIQASAQSIMESFSMFESSEGVIIVKEFGYVGFLSAASLLRVIGEQSLAQARDSNPLTKLPGNASISNYVGEATENVSEHVILVYLDLDNFKAFNDTYGFRQGDRVILMFAELMHKFFTADQDFLAHVGGDDFFVGIRQMDFIEAEKKVAKMLDIFARDVASFYDIAVREQGFISAKDRHGVERQFPLMTCSAALISLPAGRDAATFDYGKLDHVIATLKKEAKVSENHLATYRF